MARDARENWGARYWHSRKALKARILAAGYTFDERKVDGETRTVIDETFAVWGARELAAMRATEPLLDGLAL